MKRRLENMAIMAAIAGAIFAAGFLYYAVAVALGIKLD